MLPEITREEQPSYDPVGTWAESGSGAPDAGIGAPAVWVREDSVGHELQRGVWSGEELPQVGEPDDALPGRRPLVAGGRDPPGRRPRRDPRPQGGRA